MKNLYIVGGTMGVGKTSVCQQLKKILPNSVFLDGDWCWDADPFQVTDETKAMVTDNIRYLLNNFLHCTAYENVDDLFQIGCVGLIKAIDNFDITLDLILSTYGIPVALGC